MTRSRTDGGATSPRRLGSRQSTSGGASPVSFTHRISLTKWISRSSSKEIGEKPGSDAELLKDWGVTREQEASKLKAMRAKVEERAGPLRPAFDDFYLRRFLRARQYDVGKAVAMFMAHLAFRKEHSVDSVLEDFHFDERDAVLSIYPQGYHKTDREGRPVYIQHLGQVNLSKLKSITTEKRMVQYHIQEYERCLRYIFPACSKLAGHRIDTTLTIMDLKGVGMRHLTGDTKRILSEIIAIDSNNYPETLGKTLIINSPGIFKMIWSFIKPMLDSRTQTKVEVCSSNYLPDLLKYIDIENIPQYLGGKSKGSLVEDVGPWQIPELVAEIDADAAKRDGLPPPTKETPVAHASVETPPASGKPGAEEQDDSEPSTERPGTDSTPAAPGTQPALQRQTSVYMDAEEFYDAASRRGSFSQLSGEDSGMSTPAEFGTSLAGSPAAPRMLPVPEGEPTPLASADPGLTVSFGSVVPETGETASLVAPSPQDDAALMRGGLQIPILARLRALEQRFPQVERGLRAALRGEPLPSRGIGTGTLASRVAALERAMDTLLVAQATVLQQQADAGVAEQRNDDDQSSGACGCCVVM